MLSGFVCDARWEQLPDKIEDKLRSLATSSCAARNLQPLIDAVWALDRADDASLPIRLAVPSQP
jgi:hypothetical protein